MEKLFFSYVKSLLIFLEEFAIFPIFWFFYLMVPLNL